MGGSRYNGSSYSGKGSTTSSTSSVLNENSIRKASTVRGKTPMVEMLELLEEVERCRDVVISRQADLDSAKKDLEKAEQKVKAQINKLDPETKARFKRMMGAMDEKEKEKEQDDFER